MSRLVVAALVLLVAMAALVGAAAWNRNGEVQSITLSEREAWLSWSALQDDEGEGERAITMRLQWHSRDDPQDARLWLSDAKLQEIGFVTGVPAGAPGAEEFYGRSLPRVAWVAFEFNGPAWRQIEERLKMRPEPLNRMSERDSRLVPIDAGPEREALLRRHAGAQVLVLQAVIAMRYANDATRGPSVWGTVDRLVVGEVSVPRDLRAQLDAARSMPRPFADDRRPVLRYEVALRAGRLGPWLAEVKNVSIDD